VYKRCAWVGIREIMITVCSSRRRHHKTDHSLKKKKTEDVQQISRPWEVLKFNFLLCERTTYYFTALQNFRYRLMREITFSTDRTWWMLRYWDALLPFISIQGSSGTRLWTGSLKGVHSIPCGTEKNFFSFFLFSPSPSSYSFTYNGHEKVCGIHFAIWVFLKRIP